MKYIYISVLFFVLTVNIASAQESALSSWLETFRMSLVDLLATFEASESGSSLESEGGTSREKAEENVSQASNRLEVLLEREAERLGPDEAERNCPLFYGDVLGVGTVGPDVERLQTFLVEKYDSSTLNITGVFDAETMNLVQLYQKESQIVSSGFPETTGFGQVGPRTRLSIAEDCRERVVNPDVIQLEGICMTNAPCASIRPKGTMSGRINFFNPIQDADVGEYVVVEGFYTTEKRSSYHGQDFRVQRMVSKTGIMDIEEDLGGNIQFWLEEDDSDLLHIITTVIDCNAFQLQVQMKDGSSLALDTDSGIGLLNCIEVNEEGRVVFGSDTVPVPVSRYYSFRPAQDVYAVELVFNRRKFIE